MPADRFTETDMPLGLMDRAWEDAPFVLIDDAAPPRTPEDAPKTLLFIKPERIIRITRPEDAPRALDDIDRALAAGRYVAGFMAYELGYVLEPKLAPLCPPVDEIPGGELMWMGVFDAPVTLAPAQVRALMETWGQAPHAVELAPPAMDRQTYLERIARVREHIEAGDVYQINFTFPQPLHLDGSPLSLYARLRERQRAAHGAIVRTDARHVLSLSPELFVRRDGDVLQARPMKGTAKRQANPQADAHTARWLIEDEKSRAENLMIVDLLRNDLGRIAQMGSVDVTRLFEVETYPTVHQMTSSIRARLKPDTTFSQAMRALFPCGSVTGAPKVKAMEIIQALEDRPRGVYTGAVGYAGPKDAVGGGEMHLNVAIRTLSIEADGTGEMGIGSGIVYDSDAPEEWDECHVKARFLTRPAPAFALLETLKWTPEGGFALLDFHVERLSASAAYFGYPLDVVAVKEALETAVSDKQAPLRVRLTVDGWGDARIETRPLPPPTSAAWRFVIAEQPIDADNPFVYHKTTRRDFYDDPRRRAQVDQGADEVVFCNAQGQLTEGAITNLFVERAGELLTPPVRCGLLAGTLRRQLLESGRAREQVLHPDDLDAADRVFLGNSVRGLVPATRLS